MTDLITLTNEQLNLEKVIKELISSLFDAQKDFNPNLVAAITAKRIEAEIKLEQTQKEIEEEVKRLDAFFKNEQIKLADAQDKLAKFITSFTEKYHSIAEQLIAPDNIKEAYTNALDNFTSEVDKAFGKNGSLYSETAFTELKDEEKVQLVSNIPQGLKYVAEQTSRDIEYFNEGITKEDLTRNFAELLQDKTLYKVDSNGKAIIDENVFQELTGKTPDEIYKAYKNNNLGELLVGENALESGIAEKLVEAIYNSEVEKSNFLASSVENQDNCLRDGTEAGILAQKVKKDFSEKNEGLNEEEIERKFKETYGHTFEEYKVLIENTSPEKATKILKEHSVGKSNVDNSPLDEIVTNSKKIIDVAKTEFEKIDTKNLENANSIRTQGKISAETHKIEIKKQLNSSEESKENMVTYKGDIKVKDAGGFPPPNTPNTKVKEQDLSHSA
jgi:hypothetical protein